jgi:PTS system nitrogen regulatory IIA component
MKITDILVREALVLDLASTEKSAVLGELAGALAAAEPGLDADALLHVLSEREKLQSTGIGDGVAIPHGKLPGLPRLISSFARSRAGVDFESIDGQKTHLFFLLVVPEHAGGQHLKALARISRFFRDTEFRKLLEEAETVDDVLRAIEEEDAKF